jgi:hypothetical protein
MAPSPTDAGDRFFGPLQSLPMLLMPSARHARFLIHDNDRVRISVAAVYPSGVTVAENLREKDYSQS